MKKAPSKRITLKDVAAAANCSIAVASRALSTDNNQNKTVNANTALAVIKAAQDLGYMPQQRNTKSKPLGQVGVFIPENYSAQVLHLLAGISTEAEKYNTPICYFANASGSHYRRFADECNSRNRITGVISYYPSDPAHLPDFLYMCDKLRRSGSPLVLIHNNVPADFDAVSVKFDNYYGGKLAGEYLKKQKHTTCYIFCSYAFPEKEAQLFQEKKRNYLSSRVLGCYNYLNENGISCIVVSDKQLHRPMPLNHHKLHHLYNVINLTETESVGIFCTAGGMALNLQCYLLSKGVEIGKKVKIIGYDDESFLSYAYPAISSISQPFELMGKKAFQKLFNMLQGKKETSELLKPELIIRDYA